MDDVEARLALLEAHIENLIERVYDLEGKGQRGRQAKPILVKEEGICGLDPESDSATCPYASIYRKQKGCKGTACVAAASTYYANYRREH
jgi:hypothetical protein